jgi:ABC-type glycerol-3-phosphate transport system substrate-binding protein
VRRLGLLSVVALLAASCGESSTTTTTSSTPAATSTTLSEAAKAHPHATALAALRRCDAAVAGLQLRTVAKGEVDATKQRIATVTAACGDVATLATLARFDPTDAALGQAADAETAVSDGLVNYGHYLDHVAGGTNGKKIYGFAVEELRQAKLLLADALNELR